MDQRPEWLEESVWWGKTLFFVLAAGAAGFTAIVVIVMALMGAGYAGEQWLQAKNGETQCRERALEDLDESAYTLGRGMRARIYDDGVSAAVLVLPLSPASDEVWTVVCHFSATDAPSGNLYEIETELDFREYEVFAGDRLERLEGLSQPLVSTARILRELEEGW